MTKLNSGDRESLLFELRAAGAEIFSDSKIRCPFHSDSHPSAGIYQGDDGSWRFHCLAGSCLWHGDAWDVLAAAQNKPLADVVAEKKPDSMAGLRARRDSNMTNGSARGGIVAPTASGAILDEGTVMTQKPKKLFESIDAIKAVCPGEIENVYLYTNPETRKPDLAVIRYRQDGKKHFWQASPCANGWVLKRPEGLLPLYNRLEVRSSSVVIVGEGEKVVHALRKSGWVGTTSPMGAGKAAYADWTPLAGKKLYLWPDNDEAGIKHMQDVAEIVSHLDPSADTYWIDPDGLNLPVKGDVVDFVEGRADAHEAIAAVLDTAQRIGGAADLDQFLEDTISGKRCCVSLPWSAVHRQSRALFNDTITVLCGSAGCSKSYAVLQMLRHWYDIGVKAAAFELEENRAYHLSRALAQESETSDLMDDEWVRACPEETRRLRDVHRPIMDAMAGMIYAAPDKQVNYAQLVDWTRKRAAEGCRVIVIDPVTAVSPEKDVWRADSEFIFELKAITRQYQCSIVLVTHPRKGRGGSMGLDDMAGGAAFNRFTQTVLWLEAPTKLKCSIVVGPTGRFEVKCNRMIHVFKCRNGPGSGTIVGMMWDGKSLKLAEQGIVIKEVKSKKGNSEEEGS
jgi:hypothetical protein